MGSNPATPTAETPLRGLIRESGSGPSVVSGPSGRGSWNGDWAVRYSPVAAAVTDESLQHQDCRAPCHDRGDRTTGHPDRRLRLARPIMWLLGVHVVKAARTRGQGVTGSGHAGRTVRGHACHRVPSRARAPGRSLTRWLRPCRSSSPALRGIRGPHPARFPPRRGIPWWNERET